MSGIEGEFSDAKPGAVFLPGHHVERRRLHCKAKSGELCAGVFGGGAVAFAAERPVGDGNAQGIKMCAGGDDKRICFRRFGVCHFFLRAKERGLKPARIVSDGTMSGSTRDGLEKMDI